MKAIGVAPYEVNYFNQHHLCLDDPLPLQEILFKGFTKKLFYLKKMYIQSMYIKIVLVYHPLLVILIFIPDLFEQLYARL